MEKWTFVVRPLQYSSTSLEVWHTNTVVVSFLFIHHISFARSSMLCLPLILSFILFHRLLNGLEPNSPPHRSAVLLFGWFKHVTKTSDVKCRDRRRKKKYAYERSDRKKDKAESIFLHRMHPVRADDAMASHCHCCMCIVSHLKHLNHLAKWNFYRTEKRNQRCSRTYTVTHT